MVDLFSFSWKGVMWFHKTRILSIKFLKEKLQVYTIKYMQESLREFFSISMFEVS